MRITKLVHRVPIYDGDSIRILQEYGYVPWTAETNALADELDAHPERREDVVRRLAEASERYREEWQPRGAEGAMG